MNRLIDKLIGRFFYTINTLHKLECMERTNDIWCIGEKNLLINCLSIQITI